MYKCDSKTCANNDAKEAIIKCNGLCGNAFHAACLGLPRKWIENGMKESFMNHFICDSCIPMVSSMAGLFKSQQDHLNELESRYIRMFKRYERVVEENSEKFRLLTEDFVAYRKQFEVMEAALIGINLDEKWKQITDRLDKIESSVSTTKSKGKNSGPNVVSFVSTPTDQNKNEQKISEVHESVGTNEEIQHQEAVASEPAESNNVAEQHKKSKKKRKRKNQEKRNSEVSMDDVVGAINWTLRRKNPLFQESGVKMGKGNANGNKTRRGNGKENKRVNNHRKPKEGNVLNNKGNTGNSNNAAMHNPYLPVYPMFQPQFFPPFNPMSYPTQQPVAPSFYPGVQTFHQPRQFRPY